MRAVLAARKPEVWLCRSHTVNRLIMPPPVHDPIDHGGEKALTGMTICVECHPLALSVPRETPRRGLLVYRTRPGHPSISSGPNPGDEVLFG